MSYDDVAEEIPVADHQGNLGTCVRFATAKAVMNGHETRKFYDEAIDFKQDVVTQVLINEHKVWQNLDAKKIVWNKFCLL